jgi:aminopeptidase N
MRKLFTFFLISWAAGCAAQHATSIPVEPGVSYALATYRQHLIHSIQYELQFDIPSAKDSGIAAQEIVHFGLSTLPTQPLQLDCKLQAGNIEKVSVNGKPVAITLQAEHLLVPPNALRKGTNEIAINFTAGNASLNRNEDYLYALFVPDHARTVFPCFDQPSLKARYQLTLQVPTGWQVLANALLKDSVVNDGKTTYHFANSNKLSTYLFSFTAGKYQQAIQQLGQWGATFLYRETDTAKIRLSVDSIFAIHQNAIHFLEDYTGIPFPFQKVGFVAIPDFQFGGMEHPGEVQYKASSLFLDGGATKDQLIGRISLISHETAHMWFGDLVTMRWFNDVWMKEVFANFMADKVTEKMMGTETFNLKFLQDHYPAAYSIDRTQGAHPIRQQLDNLQDAGSLYGNIIYHKAPIMMRQLELLMGKDSFRLGLQEYLKKYAYGNADWPDLIGILSKHSRANLYQWNTVWVNEPGRPTFDYKVAYSGNAISKFSIRQQDERGKGRTWPQQFAITLFYPDHAQTLTVRMNSSAIELAEAKGLAKPSYILLNSDGIGYGLFPVDTTMLPAIWQIESPLQRASAYISLYENMLAGRFVKPEQLLRLLMEGLAVEQNELNLRLLTGYMGTIYWTFLPPAKRNAITQELEQTIWQALQQQAAANNRKILFKAYQEVYGSTAAKDRIYIVWQKQQPPTGVTLTEDDYTSLALSIALKSDSAATVLPQQMSRIKNSDRQKRLAFLMPALSTDSAVRDRFFASLKERSNREKEAWVTTALSYLHHPLRQSTSLKYLPASLNMLEEIKNTGDIFFPQSWLGATLGSYQNLVAARIVRTFLQQHPHYNPKLRDKLLQAADNIFRAEKLVNQL